MQGAISPILAPILRQLADPLLATLGIRLGEVDVSVFGIVVACSISGLVYHDRNRNGTLEASESGQDGAPLFINAARQGRVLSSVAVNPGTGAFTVLDVPAGPYELIVTRAANAASPQAPAGFSFITPSSGVRTVVLGENGLGLAGQDFGLALLDPGRLTLTKGVRNLSQGGITFTPTGEARPGDVLEYQLSFDNPGLQAVGRVVLNDTVPVHTELEENTYGASGEVEVMCPVGMARRVDLGAAQNLELPVLELCGVELLLPGTGGDVRFQVEVQ